MGAGPVLWALRSHPRRKGEGEKKEGDGPHHAYLCGRPCRAGRPPRRRAAAGPARSPASPPGGTSGPRARPAGTCSLRRGRGEAALPMRLGVAAPAHARLGRRGGREGRQRPRAARRGGAGHCGRAFCAPTRRCVRTQLQDARTTGAARTWSDVWGLLQAGERLDQEVQMQLLFFTTLVARVVCTRCWWCTVLTHLVSAPTLPEIMTMRIIKMSILGPSGLPMPCPRCRGPQLWHSGTRRCSPLQGRQSRMGWGADCPRGTRVNVFG